MPIKENAQSANPLQFYLAKVAFLPPEDHSLQRLLTEFTIISNRTYCTFTVDDQLGAIGRTESFMLPKRSSLFTGILTISVPAALVSSATADWIAFENRSTQQQELQKEASPEETAKLPQAPWATNIVSEEGQLKPQSWTVGQSVDVWKPVSRAAVATDVPTAEQAEQNNVATSQLDADLERDVERLLTQEELWFAPAAHTDPVQAALQTVSHAERSVVQESLTYLDELAQLEGNDAPWIQSAVVIAEQKMDLDVNFDERQELVETQPMFMNDLQELALRQTQEMQIDVPEYAVPPHLVELQELERRNLMIRSVSVPSLAQAPAIPAPPVDPGYNPAPKTTMSQEGVLESLFAPVTGIKVTGNSTAPPEAAKLKTPPNDATPYFDALIPAAYVSSPILGVVHPSRYPVCFTHNPLYYEDANLERCGTSCGMLATARSFALFCGQTAAMPYLVLATPPRTCMSTLGDCRTCEEFGSDAYFREWRKH